MGNIIPTLENLGSLMFSGAKARAGQKGVVGGAVSERRKRKAGHPRCA